MVKQEGVDKVGRILHVPQPHTPEPWLFHSGSSPNPLKNVHSLRARIG